MQPTQEAMGNIIALLIISKLLPFAVQAVTNRSSTPPSKCKDRCITSIALLVRSAVGHTVGFGVVVSVFCVFSPLQHCDAIVRDSFSVL